MASESNLIFHCYMYIFYRSGQSYLLCLFMYVHFINHEPIGKMSFLLFTVNLDPYIRNVTRIQSSVSLKTENAPVMTNLGLLPWCT